MSKDSVKTQIDTDITNKTTSKSISPLNVGSNMKAIIDLIPEGSNITKTNGSVVAINGSKATLQYDINTVIKDDGSEVKLPTTTEVGKEILFLAGNYSGTVSVYVNDAEDVKLSGGINGVSGNQGNLQINANEAYRFIYRTNDYWYFEKIIDIPTNYYQLVSERTTDGTLATNSNFKYPTEQAVKTYVDTNNVNQDLQSVLDEGGIASKGNSSVIFLEDIGGSILSEIAVISDDTNTSSSIRTQLNTASMTHTSLVHNASFQVSNYGSPSVTYDRIDLGARTDLKILTPLANTTINIPAKSLDGTYTLATLDDTQPKEYLVSTLPTPTGSEPVFAIVTDATAPTYLGTLTGGGSVVCPVFYNGTSWVSH